MWACLVVVIHCMRLWDISWGGGKEPSSVREQQANFHMWIGSSQALQFVYQK